METCNTPGERTVAWKWAARFGYVSKIEPSGLADRVEMGSRERGESRRKGQLER